MLASNVIIAAAVILWAGTAAAGPILGDDRSFVFRMMQDDDDSSWKRHLRVKIKTNTNALQSKTVRGILRELSAGLLDPGSDVGDVTKTVTVSAVAVVANVVTRHFAESEALDFALSALASAIRCRTLSYVAIQLRAIIATPESDRDPLLAGVRQTLNVYVHKLARLKEPLNVEFEMFNGWDVAMRHAADDTTPVHRHVKDVLMSECETDDPVTNTTSFDSPSDPKTIFDMMQDKLAEMFNDIPF